jgi:hypothetical protein
LASIFSDDPGTDRHERRGDCTSISSTLPERACSTGSERSTVARYLINIATPPPGATCEQDVVPFAGG